MVHVVCDTYATLDIGQMTPKLGQDLAFLSDMVLRLNVHLGHMAPRYSSIIPNLLLTYYIVLKLGIMCLVLNFQKNYKLCT
jgi:hypothetical protein